MNNVDSRSLINLINSYIIGDPFDQKTEQGPQIDETQLNKILSLIKEGVNQGAKLLHGGGRHGNEGYFVTPTVFADVEEDHIIAKEEVRFNHHFNTLLYILACFKLRICKFRFKNI